MALGQLVVGPMSDKWGRRRPLLVGMIVYVLATALCALAPTAELLVAFRLLQGLAGRPGIVIARAVVRDLYDGVEMARFFSTLMLISGVAPVIAPLIGGQVPADHRLARRVRRPHRRRRRCSPRSSGRSLPETLEPGERHGGGVGEALRTMRGLLADRVFTGYMLAGGFAFAALLRVHIRLALRDPGDLRGLPADLQPALRPQLRRPGRSSARSTARCWSAGSAGQGPSPSGLAVITLAAAALLLMSTGRLRRGRARARSPPRCSC